MRTVKLVSILLWLLILSQSTNSSSGCSVLYPIQEGNRWGFIDCFGKIVITPQFLSMPSFEEGYAVVDLEDPAKAKTREKDRGTEIQSGVVDSLGKITVFPETRLISQFSEGFVFGKRKSVWGFFDEKGTMVLSFEKLRLDDESPLAFNFSEGLAGLNAKNGGVYFVDHGGKTTFHKNYLSSSAFTEGLAIVSLERGSTIVDRSGRQLIPAQETPIDYSEGLFRLESEKGRWKYITIEGRTVFELTHDYAGNFYEGLALVQENEKWGYVDKSGKVKINLNFDEARDYAEGLAEVRISNKWGFIDKNGKFVILPTFDYVVKSFKQGMAYVQKSECEGYIDRSGKWIWTKGACEL